MRIVRYRCVIGAFEVLSSSSLIPVIDTVIVFDSITSYMWHSVQFNWKRTAEDVNNHNGETNKLYKQYFEFFPYYY